MKLVFDKKSEVSTPLWVVMRQNELVDSVWFGREEVFAVARGEKWSVTKGKINFPKNRSWQDYVNAPRLEIACGEAPYLTSYSGEEEIIPLSERIGLFDRKMRIIDENAKSDAEWRKWAMLAMRAVYGCEINEEKVQRARNNLWESFVEYYERRLKKLPPKSVQEKVWSILKRNVIVRDILKGEKIFSKVEFDAIVGNPPYHIVGGAGGSNDAPIYQTFTRLALALKPKFLSLVIPARWFASGRKNLLRDFRREMLEDAGLRTMTVYAEAKAVFPWVSLNGGVCYFLAERGFTGSCDYTLVENGRETRAMRELGEFDVLVRDAQLARIVEKVERKIDTFGLKRVEDIVSGNTPFGITSTLYDASGRQVELFIQPAPEHNVSFYFFDKPERVMRYISRDAISKHMEWIEKPKVLLPSAGGTGGDRNILGRSQVVVPNSACSQSFLCAVFDDDLQAQNFVSYVKTRFFRALVKASKVSQSAARQVYHFVPLEDFTEKSNIDWAVGVREIERQLYDKYGLDEDDIKYIDEHIAEWDF